MNTAKKTKASQIRELLAQGKTTKEIAAAIGVTVTLVNQVKWYDRNKLKKAKSKATPAKRGRPRKDASLTANQLAALEAQIYELRVMISNLQQKRPMSERIRALFQ